MTISADLYEAIIANFPNGMVALFDRELRFRVINGTGIRDIGMRPAELIGKRLRDVFPEEVYRRDEPALLAALRGESTENLVEFGDQHYRVVTTPIEGANGRIDHGLVMSQNITAFVHAEAEVRKYSEKLALAVGAAGVGIWTLDPATGVFDWNDQMFEIYGVSGSDEAGGGAWIEYVHPEDRLEVEASLRRLEASEVVVNVDFRVIRPDGELRHVVGTGGWLHDARGAKIGSFGVHIDVTDRVTREQELRAKDRMLLEKQRLESLGFLAGGVAHDFNNILHSIMLNTELAFNEVDESRRRSRLAVILRSCERAAGLCDQLLTYAGRHQQTLEVIEPAAFLMDCNELLDLSRARGVRINYASGERLPNIAVDTIQLRQVLVNLVVNAADAVSGRAEGVLEVACAEAPSPTPVEAAAGAFVRDWTRSGSSGFVTFSVRDNGPGIDPEVMPRVIEPYFSTKREGHGLGLSTVVGIIQAHEGAICIDSEVGVGTTVSVSFPVTTGASATERRSAHAEFDLGGRLVLVVDDDELIVSALELMLTALGAKVITADSGEAALRLFEQHEREVCLALLDVTMPGMSGLELAEALRCRRAELPIIITSGYGASISKQSLVPYHWLAKPYSRMRLLEVFREIFEP